MRVLITRPEREATALALQRRGIAADVSDCRQRAAQIEMIYCITNRTGSLSGSIGAGSLDATYHREARPGIGSERDIHAPTEDRLVDQQAAGTALYVRASSQRRAVHARSEARRQFFADGVRVKQAQRNASA